MEYYKLRTTTENKLWKKYFVYAERFLENDKEIKFSSAYKNGKIKHLQIQALNNDGCLIKRENDFQKEKMPEFSIIEKILLIREDIIDFSYFSDLDDINFCEVKIDGVFSKNYKLLNFANSIHCIDERNSKRAKFEFLSTLVLDSSKIPNNTNGFFLDGWDKYNGFVPIVSSNLRDKLLAIDKARDFLIFDRVEVR